VPLGTGRCYCLIKGFVVCLKRKIAWGSGYEGV